MRTPLIAGNWKMFKTVQEAVLFVTELQSAVRGVTDVNIEIVWEPAWNPSLMSDAARLQLGLL